MRDLASSTCIVSSRAVLAAHEPYTDRQHTLDSANDLFYVGVAFSFSGDALGDGRFLGGTPNLRKVRWELARLHAKSNPAWQKLGFVEHAANIIACFGCV